MICFAPSPVGEGRDRGNYNYLIIIILNHSRKAIVIVFFIRQLPILQGSWADQHYTLLKQRYDMIEVEAGSRRAVPKMPGVYPVLQEHGLPFS